MGLNAADKCTGIPGLDQVMISGFPLNRVTLVQGPPGSGKTTMGMQFLVEGSRHGQSGIYVTLADSKTEIDAFAASHGFSMEGITVLEMLPPQYLRGESQNIFRTGEIEIAEVSKRIISEAERLRPSRLVIDSLSELRLALPDDTRFRRQITAIKHVMTRLGITTLLLEPIRPGQSDPHLQTVAHAVIELETTRRFYGGERRRMCITKMRDFEYVPGYHDFDLTREGIRIYPRVARRADGRRSVAVDTIASGIAEFDVLVGGGIQRGTTTLLTGTTGTGKSCMAMQFAIAAAARGERSHAYLFDESIETTLLRTEGLGLRLSEAIDKGLIRLEELDPAELSPGEFAERVRAAVEADGARIVIIDSLSGYLNALPEENALVLQMHELGADLNRRKVNLFLILAQVGVYGGAAQSVVDLSYLADAVVLFRSFEASGSVRTAISMVKKRYGYHEKTIRELLLEPGHIRIGPVLQEFEGVLTGTPRFSGRTGDDTLLIKKTPGDDSKR